MIITAHIGATFGGVLKYVHKANVNLPEEQKPIILEENHVHGTHQDQARLMNYVSKINSRSIYPVLHLTVSYPEKDNPTQKEVDKHLKEVIKGFGATAENNQYVIVAHRDSAKDIANRTAHYHIVINKVGFNGQNINTDWYKNNAQVVADKIEQQYDLTRTIGRDVLYDSDPKNEKGYKYATKKEKITALVTRKKAGKDYVINDKRKKVLDAKVAIAEKVGQALLTSRNPQELSSKLAEHGITVGVSVDKENNNAIRGISFKSDEIKVGGKEIGYSWQTINDTFHVNQAKSLESAIVAPSEKQSLKDEQNAVPTENESMYAKANREMREEQKAVEPTLIPIATVAPVQIHAETANRKVDDCGNDILKTAKGIGEFRGRLLEKEIEVEFIENKTGTSDVIFIYQGIEVKGSEVGLNLNDIKEKIKSNLDQAIATGATPTEVLKIKEELKEKVYKYTPLELTEKEEKLLEDLNEYDKIILRMAQRYQHLGCDLIEDFKQDDKVVDEDDYLIVNTLNGNNFIIYKSTIEPYQKIINENLEQYKKEFSAYEKLRTTPKETISTWDKFTRADKRKEEKNKEIENAIEPRFIPFSSEDKQKLYNSLRLENPFIAKGIEHDKKENEKKNDIIAYNSELNKRESREVYQPVKKEKTAKQIKKEEKRERKEEKKEEKQQKGGPKVW